MPNYLKSMSEYNMELWQYALEISVNQRALNECLEIMKNSPEVYDVFNAGIERAQACIDKTLSIFQNIEDETQRNMITDRALYRLTFPQLADKYRYSERQCKRIYKAGIDELISKGFELN